MPSMSGWDWARKTRLFDTTPSWLSLSLASLSASIIVTGMGAFLGLPALESITPYTLLLHLTWSVTVSTWVLNLRMSYSGDKRALVALGSTIMLGSAWGGVQQWLSYVNNGVVNELPLVIGTMVMDAIGGLVTCSVYHFNNQARANAPKA